MLRKKLQIGVIGSAGPEEYRYEKPNKKIYQLAFEVGQIIAKKNLILICGGKGGIMEKACQGAKKYSGITVGIISGNKRNKANKFIDVEIISGIVNGAEDSIIISSSDGLIVIGGGAGTLKEISLAYQNKKPIVALTSVNGWGKKLADIYLDERKNIKIVGVKNPKKAVETLIKLINQSFS